MNSRKGISAGKKRESRIGSRKVTSLSAEQLERKRANDREAQRTIRQRTKEHIEHLERRVAELSAKEEQFDNALRRNTALEAEIAHLRHQLAMSGSGTLYPAGGCSTVNRPVAVDGSRRSSTTSAAPSIVHRPYPAPQGHHDDAHISSMPPVSRRVSVAHDWQSYMASRPSPLNEAPKSDYAGEVGPYLLDGQTQAPRFDQTITAMNLVPGQMGLNPQDASTLTPLGSYPAGYTSSLRHTKGREHLAQNLHPTSPYEVTPNLQGSMAIDESIMPDTHHTSSPQEFPGFHPDYSWDPRR
ncbi:bZIP transcription factor, putative [Paecilomyces variotii No. 5]|uniref:BZIP transcription factor, putative n=1 Tax=Byssochlamys spectabilis (strain No. 5 / NBRC 109023) TaxID=1356009 RepID=V5HTI5_BYSSN|nr:bZIP transcription factor, putative [Paecilomyces variotii No. 5]